MKLIKTSALLALLSVAGINAQSLKSPDGNFEMNFQSEKWSSLLSSELYKEKQS